jgi:hypothetical protein
MRNFKFLMLTLLLFVFMVPVKAMPNYSVQKTESIFQKQSDHVQIVLNVNVESVFVVLQSRAIVPETFIYKSFEPLKHRYAYKNTFPLIKCNLESNFYYKKIPYSIV